MRQILLVILLAISCSDLCGQSWDVSLSDKHVQRLEQLSGRTRLLRYISYYKKDSARWARVVEKSELPLFDSIRLKSSPVTGVTINGLTEQSRKFVPANTVPSVPFDALNRNVKIVDDESVLEKYELGTDTISAFETLLNNGVAKMQRDDQLRRVSYLLKKYSEYANSADLSCATKKNSLIGQSWPTRVVSGMNFQMVSLEPFTINLAPAFGYRITKRWHVGTALNYQVFASDANLYAWGLTARDYRIFTSYLFSQSLFGQLEWEKSKYKTLYHDNVAYRWRSNYNVGVGKKLLIHPKMYFTVTALYNVSVRSNPESDRFQVRFGFELSELATRQRKMHYDPNQK